MYLLMPECQMWWNEKHFIYMCVCVWQRFIHFTWPIILGFFLKHFCVFVHIKSRDEWDIKMKKKDVLLSPYCFVIPMTHMKGTRNKKFPFSVSCSFGERSFVERSNGLLVAKTINFNFLAIAHQWTENNFTFFADIFRELILASISVSYTHAHDYHTKGVVGSNCEMTNDRLIFHIHIL
jgi:hypothetical protein